MQSTRKKPGRFIKKDDPVRKVMKITEFNLAEICERPQTYHDNANANIIHEKLHSDEELAESVRDSHEINERFAPSEERLVIRPLDFTEEWKRQRKRQANRSSRSGDEDEEFDMEAHTATRQQMADERVEAEAESQAEIPAELGEGESEAPAPSPVPEPVLAKPASSSKAPEPKDDFVPYHAPHNASQQVRHEPHAPEVLYPSEEELEKIREAARSEGYRQGYRQGEEKATLESRAKVNAILEEVAAIVGNLQGMQQAVLSSVQDNFQTICESLVGALLQREFKIQPEAFGLIIERAIAEALPEDEYRIFVSSSVAKDLQAWSNSELKKNIRADEKLQDFHFRVEGKHASVDANLDKIISDLLEQADLSLFESQERAS